MKNKIGISITKAQVHKLTSSTAFFIEPGLVLEVFDQPLEPSLRPPCIKKVSPARASFR